MLRIGKSSAGFSAGIAERMGARLLADRSIDSDGTRVNVTDLNSTNGTYIGGKQLEPMAATELNMGEEVTFGKPSMHSLHLNMYH